MQALYAKYRDQGFVILGFPCNQFGKQEPDTEAKIKEFVKKYNVEFPMFAKIDVNGSKTDPIFLFLRAKLGGLLGSSVKWNFTKFLCNRSGIPVLRFGPPTKPFDFESDIAKLLQEPQKAE